MKIKFLAHATFLITADDGTRIITDPYKTGGEFQYAAINEAADIVTVSHEHFDHNYTDGVKGKPAIFRDSGNAKGISFKTVKTAHDDTGGSQRGDNMVFVFDIDGMKVAHLGDLGHLLTEEQAAAIGDVDIVLVPVGGFFTIDAKTASENAAKLKAKVIIPMHYKTDRCDLPIAAIDIFLVGKTNVKQTHLSEVTLTPATLPKTPEIWVVEPAQ